MTGDEPVKTRTKLIETALPLDAINKASQREKSIRHGHPSTLHLWWARRPLAAARAVIFGQMVDDPSAVPELFPTEAEQERERQRLFGIIEELVLWESTTNEDVLERAREEIRRSWRRACADNAGHPRARELFDPQTPPVFHDPFAGGGALPLEAQRLGLEAYASDLNPVAVLINKAMIEIPPKFSGQPPINPESRADRRMMDRDWRGAEGLAEDVRYYGKWMRDEAERRIGHLYPKVSITEEMARERPDLERYVGRELTVIAWLWARTVKSPNPAFADVDVPLTTTFVLSKKRKKEAWVEPAIEERAYRFEVRAGTPPKSAEGGTKTGRATFGCLLSSTPIPSEYIKAEGMVGRMGARLMAIVAEGDHERVYLSPTPEHERTATDANPTWRPETQIVPDPLCMRTQHYGMTTFGDLFTNRQLVGLNMFSDLVARIRTRAETDTLDARVPDDNASLHKSGSSGMGGGGRGPTYAEAIALLLGFAISRAADGGCSVAMWQSMGDFVTHAFGRQAISMVWDFAEANFFSSSTQNLLGQVKWVARAVEWLPSQPIPGTAYQADAVSETAAHQGSSARVVSTDPPYYDNVNYADLSDFFYVWLRRTQQGAFPNLFATLAVPKQEELIATPYRHGSKQKAEAFFLDGMTKALTRLAEGPPTVFPATIYYAFKQAEKRGVGIGSSGWATFLQAAIEAGFAITATWPVRTEYANRPRAARSNSLTTSIVICCRPRPADAPTATRREFLEALRTEFPEALARLQRSNIAPVDLAQASIGPGMAIFTRYARVLNADGSAVSVGEALGLINAVLDEALTEQEGDFDADSRWALTWFDEHGYAEGEYGIAETLSKAKNTSVEGLVHAGVITSRRGKVRIRKPSELDPDWNPSADARLTVWEMTQHLIRLLESGGEQAAGALAARLGGKAESARDLAYRLYLISDRRRRSADALAFNALAQSWQEIDRIARARRAAPESQGALAIEDADQQE